MQGETAQVRKKREMLQNEGVAFDDKGTVTTESVMPCKELTNSYSMH